VRDVTVETLDDPAPLIRLGHRVAVCEQMCKIRRQGARRAATRAWCARDVVLLISRATLPRYVLDERGQ